MTSINLELIINGDSQTFELPVVSHVNKYLENIIYSKHIQEGACPLDYFENEPVSADKNVFILDKSYLLNNNNEDIFLRKDTFNVSRTNTISSPYAEISITNIVTTGKDGTEIPLFFKHELAANTVQVDIEIMSNIDEEISGSYSISLEDGAIYTNYKNHFDVTTGKYRVFLIHSVDEDGNTSSELLSIVDSVKELSWEDIDLDTGKPIDNLVAFSREENVDGFVFSMIGEGPWYWQPAKKSTLKLLKPSAGTSRDNWNVRVTNGNLKAFSNGSHHRYSISEYNTQIFNPYIPYVYSTRSSMNFINSKMLAATRGDLAIFPSNKLHVDILCYDENDIIVEAYTTDVAKASTRFEDTNVFYRDGVHSWDNESGIVFMSENIESRYTYYANYFFKANEFELRSISFNPLQNREVKDYTWVIYCIPDLPLGETSIHYIGVDKKGNIRFTSQGHSGYYDNLQLRLSSGAINPNTMIGEPYRGSNSFLTNYSNYHVNINQYLILGEVYILERELKDNSLIVDIREKTRNLKSEFTSEAFRINTKLVQSNYGYGEHGMEYARNNALIYKLPVTLLETYGGRFTVGEIQEILKDSAPASKKIIIDWDYRLPVISFDNLTLGEITFDISWEGPDLTYKIYRKERLEDAFVELDEVVDPVADFQYLDDSLSAGTYYYEFAIEENGILYPSTNTFAIRVNE